MKDSSLNLSVKPVSLEWQTGLAFIPILSLYAFSSVDKLKKGLLLYVGIGLVSYFTSIILPFPWGSGASAYLFSLPIIIYFMRKWSRQWNESLQKEDQKKNQSI